MKNTLFWSLIVFVLLYFLKKGQKSAENLGEELNFVETLKRGFQLTLKSLQNEDEAPQINTIQEPGFVDELPQNSEMASFTPEYNSFQLSNLKRKRGLFHINTIHSIS